ncbi:MAG: four helix bundle protein [Candidatus Omnitrophica bacterium]|nr:four helix bundle protein [Candidatus Omnitrophota bacterium]
MNDLKKRTQEFALQVIKLVELLPKSKASDVIGRQLMRSGTSVGANYRAACRAKSQIDFIAKLKIVEEETDEVLYWLELLVASNLVSLDEIQALKKEAEELLAITVASINTTRRNLSTRKTKTVNV